MNNDALVSLQRRTVKVLTAGQVLSGFGLGSTLSIGALLAEHISGTASWSGAAATFSTLGAATWAIPLSRVAYALGRRKALATGAAIAIAGAGLVITAAGLMQLWVLLLGLFLLGAGSATGLQARFAATDLPSSKSKGRDLSIVVWATTFGAVIGPNLFGPGEVLGDALGMPSMTGPFLITITAQTLATITFWFGLRPDPLLTALAASGKEGKPASRSFKAAWQTLRQYPQANYALAAIALSHMVMVSVMSMTPVHMEHHGATLSLVGFTISLHIAGMYAFSPVFGWLADRIGKIGTVVIGQLVLVAALLVAGFGAERFDTVGLGLFLLGLGWSAATVSGSALLVESVPLDQKTNVQGLSDSLMMLAGAFGGAISGTILSIGQFVGLNLAALIPVCIVLAYTGLNLVRRNRN
ncbi:MAG: MFS transporter [Microbacteriaceae bacterium]